MKKLLSTLIIVIAVTIGLQSCVSGCGNNHEEHRDVQGKVGDPSNCGYDFVHKRWGISYRTTTGEERQFIESDEVTCLAVIHNGGNFKVEKKNGVTAKSMIRWYRYMNNRKLRVKKSKAVHPGCFFYFRFPFYYPTNIDLSIN